MRRLLTASVCLGVAALIASQAAADDAIFRLSGWAEIPSTYRRPASPKSGQFQILNPDTTNGSASWLTC